MRIKIDKEFKALLPSLDKQEYEGLETSIKEHGVREALVVWGDILIDGHNRFAICTKYGIDFETVEMEFDDRDAAADWIDNNQLSRRNLRPSQYKGIMGRMYNRRKNTHGGDRKSSDRIGHLKSETTETIAETIAQKHGVSEHTVRRSGKLMESIGKLKDVAPGLEDDLYEGTAPSHAKIIAAAKVVKDDPKKAKEILQFAPKPKPKSKLDDGVPEKGIDMAHKAIAILNKISVKDKFRQRAFNIVKKWIAANK